MMKAGAAIKQFRECSSGNSLLEAAIVLPLAVGLMIGIVDFGLAFRTRAIAEKSLQNAARYLSTIPPSAVCGWGWARAQNMAVTGTIEAVSSSNPPLIKDWTTGMIDLKTDPSCNPTPMAFKTIDLEARVPYSPVFWNTVITMKAYHQETWIGQ